LGVLPNDDNVESQTASISQLFQLTLEGDAVVQEPSEIEHGDNLVLKRIHVAEDGTAAASHAESRSTAARISASKVAVGIKKEAVSDDESAEAYHDASETLDDDSVQDATEEILKRKAEQEKKKGIDVITLSSDEEEDDIEDDADEGSVDDGSEAWDEAWEDNDEVASDDSSDSHVDDKEAKAAAETDANRAAQPDTKPAAKQGAAGRKRKRRRAPPESPLQVIMDEKDVPAAPGKPAEIDEDDRHGLEEVSTLVDGAGKNKADREVKDRIIKLLNTGFHDQSNEHEAKNAMKLAQRLMKAQLVSGDSVERARSPQQARIWIRRIASWWIGQNSD
jgi:Protein of unknown function (DUF2786)